MSFAASVGRLAPIAFNATTRENLFDKICGYILKVWVINIFEYMQLSELVLPL